MRDKWLSAPAALRQNRLQLGARAGGPNPGRPPVLIFSAQVEEPTRNKPGYYLLVERAQGGKGGLSLGVFFFVALRSWNQKDTGGCVPGDKFSSVWRLLGRGTCTDGDRSETRPSNNTV